MAKNRKRTCYILLADWELYGDRDNSVSLFSSLKKAQEELTKCLRDDLKEYSSRFDEFEYDDEDDDGRTVHNKVPFEMLSGNGEEPLHTKWATLYSNYDSDFITYCIRKEEIR